jgi:hypothetical protein
MRLVTAEYRTAEAYVPASFARVTAAVSAKGVALGDLMAGLVLPRARPGAHADLG